MKSKISVIIAARMGSTRFPGKTLDYIEGKPMISQLVERIKKSDKINEIVIATTNQKEDDKIESWCKNNKIGCFRGSSNDVLGRITSAAIKHEMETIVEILGDNPLVHSDLIDMSVELFFKKNYDYVATLTNEYPKADKNLKKFPIGVRVQVMSINTLKTCEKNARHEHYREHATSYIAENPNIFKTGFVEAVGVFSICNRPELNFAVNTRKNFKLIKFIFKELYRKKVNFGLDDVIIFIDQNHNFYELMGDAILHRPSLIPKRSFKHKFERFADSSYSLILYSILFYIIRRIGIGSNNKRRYLNESKFKRKVWGLGYYHHFQKFNFKKAYSNRLDYAYHLFKNGNLLEKERSENYLGTMFSKKISDWLEFAWIMDFQKTSKKIFNFRNDLPKVEKILFLGLHQTLKKLNLIYMIK